MTFQNYSIHTLAPHEIAALGLARTFQTSRIFKRMTVLEHVLLGQYSHQRAGLWGDITRPAWVMEEEERSRAKGLKILSFFEERLLPRTHDFAETLSYANRRRLEIARALVSEPKLLLLDEPPAGMNPHESAGIARLIKKIRDELGITVFLIEPDMKVIMGASDRIIVLDEECTLCGRCVNVCRDLIGQAAIGFESRGADRATAVPFRKPTDRCIGCGECVHVCPTNCIKMEDLPQDRIVDRWMTLTPILKCKSCGKGFGTVRELELLRSRHPLVKPYFEKCPACRAQELGKSLVGKTNAGTEVRVAG